MREPILGLRLHWGEPDLPTKLRAYLNSLLSKDLGPEGVNNYVDHHLAKWYGISFKRKWFAGFWLFGATDYPSEHGPIPDHSDRRDMGGET